jgi:thiazole synthase
MVTVAVRRVDIENPDQDDILRTLDPEEFALLPNTAGCYSAEEAVRFARLGRASGMSDWVKLEVIGDRDTLLPDTEELLVATRTLVDEGFTVLAYTNDDLITALRLQDLGVASVMPLASPIGSGLGLLNPLNIRLIASRLDVPVIVDAGVGTASDACATMEQGVDGILMNTALAEARDPVEMATAMRLAVDAGRRAYVAGRMPMREYAVPSSPAEGMPGPSSQ